MRQHVRHTTGFSLLEVLIAVAILSIGLLGLARMQTLSLKNSQSAYYRTQATLLAYDIAERIRVNRGVASAYSLDSTSGDLSNPCGSSGTAGNDACPHTTQCATAGACSPSALAALDLLHWQQLVADTLPAGGATITRSNDVVTVSIFWDRDGDGLVNDDTADPDSEVFQTQFIP